jgi:hypothetical protein
MQSVNILMGHGSGWLINNNMRHLESWLSRYSAFYFAYNILGIFHTNPSFPLNSNTVLKTHSKIAINVCVMYGKITSCQIVY